MDDGISSASLPYVENLYNEWVGDPLSVPKEWREYFGASTNGGSRPASGPRFRPRSIFRSGTGASASASLDAAARQDKVDQLIRAYRVRGHMIAQLDPLGLHGEPHMELELAHYDLSEKDLEEVFSARTLPNRETATLREIWTHLQKAYCGAIGIQFMHIDDLQIKEWLQMRMETPARDQFLGRGDQLRILTKLTDAEIFEDFLHKKFLGAKRFSLEGGETLIPLLDQLIDEAGQHGVLEIVLGMAHRGRLNVLANILEKNPRQIFREFQDVDAEMHIGGGDVKYHMGHSADIRTRHDANVHVSMCFNPSHLEYVGPVVMGRARAKMDRIGDTELRQVMGIIIHGDAAFAGEGVVQEMLNMSGLLGYTSGGSIHIIHNNQIGFTTGPEDSRSSPYATCVAKMLQIPILHVNGEAPEAVARALKMAMDFRTAFKRDVVIDMYCYRRYGHNEGDDPQYTQPVLYKAIRKRKSVREGYIDSLLALGTLTQAECDDIAVKRRARLDEELNASRAPEYTFQHPVTGGGLWTSYTGGSDSETPDVPTSITAELATSLMRSASVMPDWFTPHPRIMKLMGARLEMSEGSRPFDWGGAEALAYASLVVGGTRVRMSGQDCGRGTFSHRHAVLRDYVTGLVHKPLSNLTDDQAPFQVYNSPLSESGPLGFEYGYSLDWPDGLIVWEAQFGDFANVAQPVIDQFIVSSEDKWRRLSGLVMLLPHGFEGQGPEHSSARLERWLTLAAEDNIQVVNLTTPAQFFHCMRRQVLRPWRKPLIVMSPKSLLRHPSAVSTLADITDGTFHTVLGDDSVKPSRVKRVLLCSGKVYYELAQHRFDNNIDNVAVLRLEQLYPLRLSELAAALDKFPKDAELLWVQEEPMNNGAWPFLRLHFGSELCGRKLAGIYREASASPATGSGASHRMIQALLLARAFTL